MRILLIHPCSIIKNEAPPLGLAYIAAKLEDGGFEVKVIDGASIYGNWNNDKIIEESYSFSPNIIGITITTPFAKQAYYLMNKLTSISSNIIAGGPHATILPEESLSNGAKIVIMGEGETTFLQLAVCLQSNASYSNIEGISYVLDNVIVNTAKRSLFENLDCIPHPAKHLFNRSEYNSFGNIVTSRGCPGRCTYCSRVIWGKSLRFASANYIYEEMLYLKEKYNVNTFHFIDDTFTANKERIYALCDLINNKRGSFSPTLKAISRIDTVNIAILKKLTETGLVTINFGIESGNKESQEKFKKFLNLDNAFNLIKQIKNERLRLFVTTNFMFGFPWETIEHLNKTFDFIKALEPFVEGINPGGVLVPYPGTEIYQQYHLAFGFTSWWLREDNTVVGGKYYLPFFKTYHFRTDDLENNYFKYDCKTKDKIYQIINYIGDVNVKKNLPAFFQPLIQLSVMLSKILYSKSPKLERLIFNHFSRFFSLMKKMLLDRALERTKNQT